MEQKTSRKYNSVFRNNLKQKMSKLTNRSDFIKIYKMISDELGNSISNNRNGIYFNLNLLSDKTIEKLNEFINYTLDSETLTTSEQTKITYETYNKESHIENLISLHKLSNQEKSIIKKYRQKDI
jgi:hypothetical protein